MEITKEYISSILEYRNGSLYWKKRDDVPNHINVRDVGKEAGYPAKGGYWYIEINSKPIYRHRLVFLMHKGYLPEFVDHIKSNPGEPHDDRIENLREASREQNQANRRINSNNTSGIKGVVWDPRSGKWRGRISKNGKRYNIGYFTTLEEAEEKMSAARKELHGEYANNG